MTIQEESAKTVASARAILRIVESERFIEQYAFASEEDKAWLLIYVQQSKKEALESWLKLAYRRNKPLESLTSRELRSKAATLKIKEYNFLTKASLLSAIKITEAVRDTARRNSEGALRDEATYALVGCS